MVSTPLEAHVGSWLRFVEVFILLVSIVPHILMSKCSSCAKEMMDELPLNGPLVQRTGALLGGFLSKHNCDTPLSQDHSCFLSTGRFGEGGADYWLVTGEKIMPTITNHK